MFFKGTWSDIIGTEMIVGPDAKNGGIGDVWNEG
jgi:hypothetical protein